MQAGFLFIWLVVAALALSSVFGLAWALRSGQLSTLQRDANILFDADEPPGQATDEFPNAGRRL